MKALISEIFQSIQGEGKNIGTPSVFIRFWGCNLRCQFRGKECDTPYAVITDKDKAITMTPEEVANSILKYKQLSHIVWTGGEPMLYQDFIIEVMYRLVRRAPYTYTAEIETNGTIPIKGILDTCIDYYTLSVKLKSSNQPNKSYDKLRVNKKAIASFPPQKTSFKFVVSSEKDLKEILQISDTNPDIDVYLMPEGRVRDEILEHAIDVADLCIKYNFKYSPREHILLWSDRRGV